MSKAKLCEHGRAYHTCVVTCARCGHACWLHICRKCEEPRSCWSGGCGCHVFQNEVEAVLAALAADARPPVMDTFAARFSWWSHRLGSWDTQ